MSRSRILVSFVLFATIVSLTAPDAMAYRRGRGRGGRGGNGRAMMIAAIAAQVAYASAVQRDAEARAAVAQTKVDSANERISGAREALASAESDERKAHAELQETEAELIQSAGEDSEIAQAKKALDEARTAMQYEEHRILTSSEYVAKSAASKSMPEHAAIVTKLRQETLGSDATYQRALTKFELAKQKFSHLRSEVITKDEKWQSGSTAVKETWTAESAATIQGITGGMRKLPAKQELHEAQRTAANARMVVMQGEAMLRALGGSRYGRGGRPGTPYTTTSAGSQ